MSHENPQTKPATGHPDAKNPQPATAKPAAPKGSSRAWGLLALLLIVIGVVWYSMSRPPSPPVASASHEVESEPAEESTAAARPPATARATLRVEANVPRAKVALDGKERGPAPLEIANLAPGRHKLQVSAEGYETRTETVDLKGGRRDLKIDLTARAANLGEGVAVKHKHRIGSCEGVLRASAGKLEYDSPHKDGFSVVLSEVEELSFEKETLTVKVRGGRKYNFDDRNDDPAALASFHQGVAPSWENGH